MAITVYLAFVNSDKGILRFLKKGFNHCFVAVQIDHNRPDCIYVEKLRGGLKIQDGTISDFKKLNYSYIKLFVAEDFVMNNRVRVLSLYTCVSIAKSIIGIKSNFIITPWQLFKYLKRNRFIPNEDHILIEEIVERKDNE